MSKELLDFLNAQGLAGLGVIIIGAGTVVAATITALNAWAVAWFNARAARQLAVDAAHRELRKKLVERALIYVHKIKYAAEDLQEALAANNVEEARRLLQAAPTVHRAFISETRERGEDWEVSDELVKDAFRRAVTTAWQMVNAARDEVFRLERLPTEQRAQDVETRTFFDEMGRSGMRLSNLVEAAELAGEAYIFGISAVRREAKRRLAALEKSA